MNRKTANQIADTIENVTRAMAEWTVNRHLKSDPLLPEKYGAFWRNDWVSHVESRFRFLAQAVALERPEVFARALQWTAKAHGEQSESLADLELSLRCMREIVREELPTAALEPTGRCIDAALDEMHANGGLDQSTLRPDAPQDRIALGFIEAVLTGEDHHAARLVLDAAKSGTPLTDLYTGILQPAMREIGILWHRGDISVAEEHLATATTRDVMARLRSGFPEPRSDARRLVAAAVAGDFHDLGLRMATDILELSGWRAWFLGANVPADILIEFMERCPANMLLLSVSTALHLRAAARTIETIRRDQTANRLKILVGGPPFAEISDLWRDIGANGCSVSLQDTVRAADAMFNHN
ncbi:MAG: B12-binding domain-containing protein [Phycisphaerales bacterium]|nr:B12-binding domain-containing protein [Phycisphaerales bacterium]MCB9858564.1 B12-binding domain-containing protein [Phycisphaerales bacterium]